MAPGLDGGQRGDAGRLGGGGPRWSAGSAVRKDDQFTAAPDFIDQHDSDHLPMWGRLEARWHGMAPQRRVLVASSLVVFAGAIGAFALFTALDLSAGPSADPSSQGLAARDDSSLSLPSPGEDPGALLNSTTPAPLPSPIPSALPSPIP